MSNAVPSIPIIILPYLYAIADASKHEAWMAYIYHEKIVPYLEKNANKIILDNNKLNSKNLLLLQDYLRQNKREYTSNERNLLIGFDNSLKYPNALLAEIESSFYANIIHRENGFSMDSFLPLTLRKHLTMILMIQLLLHLNNALSIYELNDDISKIEAFQLWIRNELHNKLSNNKAAATHKKDNFTNIHPSWIYYFFNGAQHSFVFCQVEYLNIIGMIKDVFKIINDFKKYGSNFIDATHLLTAGSLKFVFGLFLVSLAPYRFLRTLANHFSNLCSIYLQEFFFKRYPTVSKISHWHAFYFTFQFLFYVGLVLTLGLPLIPIPLSSIPEIFLSPAVMYLPLIYSGSILSASLLSRMIEKISSNEAQILEKADMPKKQELTSLERISFPHLMFDRHCAQQQDFRSNNTKALDSSQTPKCTIKLH